MIIIKNTNFAIKTNEELIPECSKEKLLGVRLDNTLSFKTHLTFLYKKASQKLHKLLLIINNMDTEK